MNKTPPSRASVLLVVLFVGLFTIERAIAVEALLLQDTYVDNGTTGGKPPPNTSNYGGGSDLRIFKGGGRIGRAFLKFSLGTLPPGTTANDVTQARLRFWVNSNTTLPGLITLNPVTTAWDELTLKDNSTVSLMFGLPKLSDLTVNSVGNFVSIDVTDWVKGWLNGTLVNEGFEIEASAASATLNLAFDSKESNQTSHEPRLEISLSKIGPAGPAGLQGPQGISGPAGTTGTQGPAGPAGPMGETGAAGPQGIAGTDGIKWFSRTGAPTENLGALYDYYLDLGTGDIWQKVSSEGGLVWSLQGSIRGASGPDGPAGTAGPVGPTGPSGPAGPQGGNGSQGAPGPAGETGPRGLVGPPGPAAVWPTHIQPQGDLSMGEFTQAFTP